MPPAGNTEHLINPVCQRTRELQLDGLAIENIGGLAHKSHLSGTPCDKRGGRQNQCRGT